MEAAKAADATMLAAVQAEAARIRNQQAGILNEGLAFQAYQRQHIQNVRGILLGAGLDPESLPLPAVAAEELTEPPKDSVNTNEKNSQILDGQTASDAHAHHVERAKPPIMRQGSVYGIFAVGDMRISPLASAEIKKRVMASAAGSVQRRSWHEIANEPNPEEGVRLGEIRSETWPMVDGGRPGERIALIFLSHVAGNPSKFNELIIPDVMKMVVQLQRDGIPLSEMQIIWIHDLMVYDRQTQPRGIRLYVAWVTGSVKDIFGRRNFRPSTSESEEVA